MKGLILGSRYRLLVVTLIIYMGFLVAEGMIIGREARAKKCVGFCFEFDSADLEEIWRRRNGNEKIGVELESMGDV